VVSKLTNGVGGGEGVVHIC